MIIYALTAAAGFGVLYLETALARSPSWLAAGTIGGLAFIAFLITFLVPPLFFRFTNEDVAPRVMSQVVSRAALASGILLALNGFVWSLLGDGISLLEELYAYSIIAISLFHGLAGAMASHILYLQQTKQYNSNQLVALMGLVTLVLLVLILYFLGLDWTTPRDNYIHLRDLTLLSLVLLAYGRAVFIMAHH